MENVGMLYHLELTLEYLMLIIVKVKHMRVSFSINESSLESLLIITFQCALASLIFCSYDSHMIENLVLLQPSTFDFKHDASVQKIKNPLPL